MLPFLKRKDAGVSGLIVKMREPDEKPQENQEEPIDDIEMCAEDLIKAIHMKDAKGAAQAIKDAFEILDSQPHEEGPHTNEE